ncbi:MAG TPA: hypothetical protein VGJ21_00165 [Terracidiphilus sp.]|jgi:hypothetical protein
MRSVPQARPWIQAGESWYCSPDCLVEGSRAVLAPLCQNSVIEMPRNPRLSLGLALLSKGFLAEHQLRTVLEQNPGARDEHIEATLLERGLVTEKQIAGARAAQWGQPALGSAWRPHPILADLPKTILSASETVPLHFSAPEKRLVLGFVRRIDHGLLQAVEKITDCRPEPCFITSAEFREQTRFAQSAAEYEERTTAEALTIEQMAKSLGQAALDVFAQEVRFARCKSHLWARLSGKRGILDAIFSVRGQRLSVRADLQPDTESLAVLG